MQQAAKLCVSTFNRTIVELKSHRRRDTRRDKTTFNRTIVELKSKWFGYSSPLGMLLIVP